MKSGKLRKEEIKAKRLERLARYTDAGKLSTIAAIRLGAVAADRLQLVHNNTYGALPEFYTDQAFTCRDCGSHELWTAKQQKWWYEIAKGPIDSRAARCRPCRIKERIRVDEARQVSIAGMARKLEHKKLKEEND
jgi:hypothetical protein